MKQLGQDTLNGIDWDAHERDYIMKLPYLKAIKVVKYFHNWQNTGVQKELFNSKQNEPEHQQHECMCPMKAMWVLRNPTTFPPM